MNIFEIKTDYCKKCQRQVVVFYSHKTNKKICCTCGHIEIVKPNKKEDKNADNRNSGQNDVR